MLHCGVSYIHTYSDKAPPSIHVHVHVHPTVPLTYFLSLYLSHTFSLILCIIIVTQRPPPPHACMFCDLYNMYAFLYYAQ